MTTDQKTPAGSAHWPATIVMCVGLVAVTTAYALSSPDQRSQILAGIAVLWGTVQAFMPAIRKATGASALLLTLALGATAHGCGAQLSESARVALAVRTQLCLVQERAIVDRTGTTAEQDAADLAASRAQCDADRAAIVEGN